MGPLIPCPYCRRRYGSGLTVHVAANACGLVPPEIIPALPQPEQVMREHDWRKLIKAVAIAAGWRVNHVRAVQDRSGKWVTPCAPGWPDLTLVRPPVLLSLECKAHRGRTSPEQVEWLADLNTVPGVYGLVAYPRDWHRLVPILR